MNSAGGRCHDHAKCELIWARFKEEKIYRMDTTCYTVEQLKVIIFRYFMSDWNHPRICSAIGGVPPIHKRQQYWSKCNHSTVASLYPLQLMYMNLSKVMEASRKFFCPFDKGQRHIHTHFCHVLCFSPMGFSLSFAITPSVKIFPFYYANHVLFLWIHKDSNIVMPTFDGCLIRRVDFRYIWKYLDIHVMMKNSPQAGILFIYISAYCIHGHVFGSNRIRAAKDSVK